MSVDLLLRVTRGEDNRLSGTVCNSGAGEAHSFSGTLELMRVFEELVPVDRDAQREDRETNCERRTWIDESS